MNNLLLPITLKYYETILNFENSFSISFTSDICNTPLSNIILSLQSNNHRRDLISESFFERIAFSSDFDNFYLDCEYLQLLKKFYNKHNNIDFVSDNDLRLFLENSSDEENKSEPYTNQLFLDLIANVDSRTPTFLPFVIVSIIQETPDPSFDTKNIIHQLLFEDSVSTDGCNIIATINPMIIDQYSLQFHSKIVKNGNELISYVQSIKNEVINNYSTDVFFDKDSEVRCYMTVASSNYNAGLFRIFEHIKNSGANDLVHQFFSIDKSKEKVYSFSKISKGSILTTSKQLTNSLQHYGAFDSDYKLAKTQRIGMNFYLDYEQDLIPINGAPGTGKTSLLRSIAGDYIVKAAMENAETFFHHGVVSFKPPILCLSTNNQALFNITTGFLEGFEGIGSKYSDNILYQRWLDFKIERKNKKTINLNSSFFVPVIKNRGEHFEILTQNILSLCIQHSQCDHFINQFQQYSRILTGNSKIDILLTAVEYFYQKLVSNTIEINSIENYQLEMAERIESVELFLINKYHNKAFERKAIQELLYTVKNITLNKNDIMQQFTQIFNTIYDLEEKLKSLTVELDTENARSKKTEQEIDDVQYILLDLENKIKDVELYISNVDKKALVVEAIKHRSELKEKEIELSIKTRLYNETSIFIHQQPFLYRIIYSLFGNGPLKSIIAAIESKYISAEELEKFQARKVIFEEVTNEHLKFHIIELTRLKHNQDNNLVTIVSKKNILNKHQENLNLIQENINTMGENIVIKQKQLEVLKKKLGIVFEDQDLLMFLSHRNDFVEIESVIDAKAKLDTTLRTENLYLSLHLLEALHFYKKEQAHTNSECINCPHCGGMMNLIVKEESKRLQCKQCRASCFLNSLSIGDVKHIFSLYLKGIDKSLITIVRTDTGWLNINFNAVAILYRNILPFFPVIQSTNNSIGSLLLDKKQDKNLGISSLFDFMLIDEAGTILPSKMLGLQFAKRVMFFGDTKQLKPVFSFTTKVEKEILSSLTSLNQAEHISLYFSCADDSEFNLSNNSAMHISNAATSLFLPYDVSNLDGDIWLKEHYRCADNIGAIANEITYDNEMVLCVGKAGLLEFIQCGGEKRKDNTNQLEAEFIVRYILDKKEEFKVKFGLNTDDTYFSAIGIITPFKNQARLINRMLERHTEDLQFSMNNVQCGTVHSYQGSAKDIIIFSTVYNRQDRKNTKNFFFNKGDSDMINVAVTRAKKAFIVFGDSEALMDNETYSGKMMNHILLDKQKLNFN